MIQIISYSLLLVPYSNHIDKSDTISMVPPVSRLIYGICEIKLQLNTFLMLAAITGSFALEKLVTRLRSMFVRNFDCL